MSVHLFAFAFVLRCQVRLYVRDGKSALYSTCTVFFFNILFGSTVLAFSVLSFPVVVNGVRVYLCYLAFRLRT